MDDKLNILLNSEKNINSVNVDTFTKLNLNTKKSKFNEYNVRNVLSVTELFDLEREENEIYRIYGGIEYLSMLDGLVQDYLEFKDFFRPQNTGDIKTIFNSFDFYLVRPSDEEYVNINSIDSIQSTTIHRRKFKILTQLYNFELFNAGFSKNVFNDDKYIYSFNIDFDVSQLLDGFGMPLTELYLYAQYRPSEDEILTFERWNNTGQLSEIPFNPKIFNVGDVVKTTLNQDICDLVEFSRPKFYQRQDTQQTFRIKTPITNPTRNIVWRYNPFIPIKLRYFEDYLNVVNKDSNSYEDLNSVPEYAFELNNGDMVWKNIMPEGFIDPLTGLGTNHPFINKKRYLFNNIVFEVYPDLNDMTTRMAFSNIWFDRYVAPINTRPITDLNNIDKPC